jgi:hypothetical protein
MLLFFVHAVEVPLSLSAACSVLAGTVAVEFETPEERQVRKMKEMPPPKQLRKLLTNAEISKLHDIGESQSPNIPFTITLPTAALCCFSLL